MQNTTSTPPRGNRRRYSYRKGERFHIGPKMRAVWNEINNRPEGVSLSELRLHYGYGVPGRLIETRMIELRPGKHDLLAFALHDWLKIDASRDLTRRGSSYALAKAQVRDAKEVQTIACPDELCLAKVGQPCNAGRYRQPETIKAPCYPRLILWAASALKRLDQH